MQSLGSSVLVVGHPCPEALTYGVDHCSSAEEALRRSSNHYYSVLVCPTHIGDIEIRELISAIRGQVHSAQLILIAENKEVQTLTALVNETRATGLLLDFLDNSLEHAIQKALEISSAQSQHSQHLALLQEQNMKLHGLQVELEERVAKRQRYLYKSRHRLLRTNERAEALQSALIAIQRARSIGEMETLLNEALMPALLLRWVRIFFTAQNSIFEHKGVDDSFSMFHTQLYHQNEPIGTIYFLRDKKRAFVKGETRFLLQVADAVSLGLDRIMKSNEAENLKQQWEATFNSITEPLCILDSNGNVLQWNNTFTQARQIPTTQIFGLTPNAILFDDQITAEQTPLGKNSRVKYTKPNGQNTVYDVFSQKITISNSEVYFVNLYYDVTDQEKMEHQLLETAKMAELGTIGSSIAHELNNPLGGMISFIQLIKMDMQTDHPLWEDILEMEKGALRCKDIVQNLLGFSRMPSSDEKEDIDLRDVIRRSASITELQTRSRGIKLLVEFPSGPCPFYGHLNMLSQAIKNLIQNCYEAISEKRQNEKSLKGEIKIKLEAKPNNYLITIEDNGAGIPEDILLTITNPLFSTKKPESNPGLGLSVSSQIIREHKGHLELESQQGVGTLAKVVLPV